MSKISDQIASLEWRNQLQNTLAAVNHKNVIYRTALNRIRNRCQITGMSFEQQSFENTEDATKALSDKT